MVVDSLCDSAATPSQPLLSMGCRSDDRTCLSELCRGCSSTSPAEFFVLDTEDARGVMGVVIFHYGLIAVLESH